MAAVYISGTKEKGIKNFSIIIIQHLINISNKLVDV